ncbi:hypothetical protein BJX64DRAFT_224497 [Aspergillus heterothallicus]
MYSTSFRSLFRKFLPSLSVRTVGSRAPLTGFFDPIQSPHTIYMEVQYWKEIPKFQKTSTDQFLNHKWQVANSITTPNALFEFLDNVLPEEIPPEKNGIADANNPEKFIERVQKRLIKGAGVNLSPHTLSVIDWKDPLNDPIRRMFVPLETPFNSPHPMALDLKDDTNYSPVDGIVHRFPDRAVFLANAERPNPCRKYKDDNPLAAKKVDFRLIPKRWAPQFEYIAATQGLVEVIVGGDDPWSLQPKQIKYIGNQLLDTQGVRRVRFLMKGLNTLPGRLLDIEDDFVDVLLKLDQTARNLGKSICLQTNFNHPHEITWIVRRGMRALHEGGVTVRNQSDLLYRVNSDVETMLSLIRSLTNLNIQPYYVRQREMIPGYEDLRTPICDALDLEKHIRSKVSGFNVPNFVVDLPGPGGKRLISSVSSYDRHNGLSKFVPPGRRLLTSPLRYWDPMWSLNHDASAEIRALYKRDTSL